MRAIDVTALPPLRITFVRAGDGMRCVVTRGKWLVVRTGGNDKPDALRWALRAIRKLRERM